ncbi:MFS transporter [Cyanobium sp. Candia 9D4]|uniref:MFS transporter n=1 Tax=Cyanobium sp. Candia 9D4 TaxID=2823707 RepID=UPI0020CF9751|nr:MFS transporter [Cyanobium sp. Candia 9D4]MCP9934187.1 MFS transporter [Cyanobium sp. Candia 9D4]
MNGSLLRRPGFRWLWLGQTLLFAGVQFWFVAVTWLMLQRTGSGTSLALVLMAAALPRGLLLLLGGVLSDRHPPRTMAVRAGWILAIATGVLTLLASRDALNLGPVLVLAAVFGAAEACLYPAALALLPRLLEDRHLGRAHAWLQGSEQISNVAGPALAGLSLAVAGATAALAFDTVLLLLAVGCFVQVRPRLAAADTAPTGGLGQGLREGIAFAWGHGAIRTGLTLIAMINLAVLGPVVIGVVELVTLRFGGGRPGGGLVGWPVQRHRPSGGRAGLAVGRAGGGPAGAGGGRPVVDGGRPAGGDGDRRRPGGGAGHGLVAAGDPCTPAGPGDGPGHAGRRRLRSPVPGPLGGADRHILAGAVRGCRREPAAHCAVCSGQCAGVSGRHSLQGTWADEGGWEGKTWVSPPTGGSRTREPPLESGSCTRKALQHCDFR